MAKQQSTNINLKYSMEKFLNDYIALCDNLKKIVKLSRVKRILQLMHPSIALKLGIRHNPDGSYCFPSNLSAALVSTSNILNALIDVNKRITSNDVFDIPQGLLFPNKLSFYIHISPDFETPEDSSRLINSFSSSKASASIAVEDAIYAFVVEQYHSKEVTGPADFLRMITELFNVKEICANVVKEKSSWFYAIQNPAHSKYNIFTQVDYRSFAIGLQKLNEKLSDLSAECLRLANEYNRIASTSSASFFNYNPQKTLNVQSSSNISDLSRNSYQSSSNISVLSRNSDQSSSNISDLSRNSDQSSSNINALSRNSDTSDSAFESNYDYNDSIANNIDCSSEYSNCCNANNADFPESQPATANPKSRVPHEKMTEAMFAFNDMLATGYDMKKALSLFFGECDIESDIEAVCKEYWLFKRETQTEKPEVVAEDVRKCFTIEAIASYSFPKPKFSSYKLYKIKSGSYNSKDLLNLQISMHAAAYALLKSELSKTPVRHEFPYIGSGATVYSQFKEMCKSVDLYRLLRKYSEIGYSRIVKEINMSKSDYAGECSVESSYINQVNCCCKKAAIFFLTQTIKGVKLADQETD